jgi:hypothetical protein
MLNHRRLLAAAVAVAASATVAVSGLTAASASPAAGTVVSGTEHFQLMTTSATSNRAQVIAYGAFTGAAVDHQGNSVDTFTFPAGSFKVRHSAGTGSQHFNPVTCLAQINLHGTYKIFGGTGKFAKIGGQGTYQLRILFIGGRSRGKCSQQAVPVAFQQLIQASGPVHL